MLKKIIYLIVSGGLLLSGCSLDYEPLNGPSSGSFPASEEEAMAGLYAAYKGLANMTVKETPFPMRINDCISDIGTYRTGAGNQIKAMSSTLTADNTMCEKVYKTVYKIAGRVHLVLDNLDRLRGVIPEDRFNQIKAELLCIRAYYYDLGCQFYGDIPFIDHQLDLDDYSDYPRIPREQVTARLLQDLDDDRAELGVVGGGRTLFEDRHDARRGRLRSRTARLHLLRYPRRRRTFGGEPVRIRRPDQPRMVVGDSV